jgi:hypothetical protein
MAACYYCASTEARYIEERNFMYINNSNIILESYYSILKIIKENLCYLVLLL